MVGFNQAYTSGNGLEETMKLTKTQYAEAVRNLADFWMGAFQLAGRPISQLSATSFKQLFFLYFLPKTSQK